MPPQRAESLLKHSGLQDAAVILQQLLDGQQSAIQLAAISNYKLAQLTFAPPDIHSLRKTAVIKNTVQYIYDITPKDWLDEMTRWEFFTLEKLDEIEMDQEGLETILSEYVRIMDSFKSSQLYETATILESLANDDASSEINENDTIMQQVFQHTEESKIPSRTSSVTNSATGSTSANGSSGSSNGDTSKAALSKAATSVSSHSSIVASPKRQDRKDQRRTSFRLNQNRISWTSDTGLPSFAASQHLAGELMSLFDMEFKVDISLDPYSTPAPQLPELSYFKEKQQHRSSVDSFMCLIPAFESFQIDNYDGHSFVSKANKRTSILAGGASSTRRMSSSLAPTRSSSLKYNQHKQSSSSNVKQLSHPTSSHRDPQKLTPQRDDMQGKASLTKKKSIRKLVSLFGKKRLNSETSLPLDHTHLTGTFKSASVTTLPSASTLSKSTSSLASYNAITPSTINSASPFNTVSPSAGSGVEQGNVTKQSSPSTTTCQPLATINTLSKSARATTLTHRRRSNSVPEIASYLLHKLIEEQEEQQSRDGHHKHGTKPIFECVDSVEVPQHSSSSHENNPASLYPSSTDSKEVQGSSDTFPKSVSTQELSSVPRMERQQSLSRSPTVQDQRNHHHRHHHHRQQQQQQQQQQQKQQQQKQQQQQQQQQQHSHHPHPHPHQLRSPSQEQNLRQYHSTQNLSYIFTNGVHDASHSNNESKESVSSSYSSPTSPISPKKSSSSSFLHRMTTFARRKKPVNSMKQHPTPAVPV